LYERDVRVQRERAPRDEEREPLERVPELRRWRVSVRDRKHIMREGCAREGE